MNEFSDIEARNWESKLQYDGDGETPSAFKRGVTDWRDGKTIDDVPEDLTFSTSRESWRTGWRSGEVIRDADFQEYRKARHLHDGNGGRGYIPQHLSGIANTIQASRRKKIAHLEAKWPVFRETYDRIKR